MSLILYVLPPYVATRDARPWSRSRVSCSLRRHVLSVNFPSWRGSHPTLIWDRGVSSLTIFRMITCRLCILCIRRRPFSLSIRCSYEIMTWSEVREVFRTQIKYWDSQTCRSSHSPSLRNPLIRNKMRSCNRNQEFGFCRHCIRHRIRLVTRDDFPVRVCMTGRHVVTHTLSLWQSVKSEDTAEIPSSGKQREHVDEQTKIAVWGSEDAVIIQRGQQEFEDWKWNLSEEKKDVTARSSDKISIEKTALLQSLVVVPSKCYDHCFVFVECHRNRWVSPECLIDRVVTRPINWIWRCPHIRIFFARSVCVYDVILRVSWYFSTAFFLIQSDKTSIM